MSASDSSTTPARRARARLTRQDWIDGALDLLAREGVDRVAVEPLAAELGTTKGSFYWHFANRDELVTAALEAWEQVATQGVIDAVDATAPSERLAQLTRITFDQAEHNALEAQIMAAANHPLVRPVIERVEPARIAYLAQLLRAAGLPAAQARARGRLIYAAYLGHLQLVTGPGVKPDRRQHRALVNEVLTILPAPSD